MNNEPNVLLTPTARLRLDRAAHLTLQQLVQANEIMAETSIPLDQQGVLRGALVQAMATNYAAVIAAAK